VKINYMLQYKDFFNQAAPKFTYNATEDNRRAEIEHGVVDYIFQRFNIPSGRCSDRIKKKEFVGIHGTKKYFKQMSVMGDTKLLLNFYI